MTYSLIASRYWIDFNKWEVFVNDDQTCSFLSLEVVTGGLAEVSVADFLSSFTAMVIPSHIEHAFCCMISHCLDMWTSQEIKKEDKMS